MAARQTGGKGGQKLPIRHSQRACRHHRRRHLHRGNGPSEDEKAANAARICDCKRCPAVCRTTGRRRRECRDPSDVEVDHIADHHAGGVIRHVLGFGHHCLDCAFERIDPCGHDRPSRLTRNWHADAGDLDCRNTNTNPIIGAVHFPMRCCSVNEGPMCGVSDQLAQPIDEPAGPVGLGELVERGVLPAGSPRASEG